MKLMIDVLRDGGLVILFGLLMAAGVIAITSIYVWLKEVVADGQETKEPK